MRGKYEVALAGEAGTSTHSVCVGKLVQSINN